ncbi:MAG: hypothetical protein L0287_37335 [Anaerolineae bacterium]|nr:hypothetical protein [Anaerolineae bacterium]MCI0607845.1 hypothetical protein [Anaerolineae bacterium]
MKTNMTSQQKLMLQAAPSLKHSRHTLLLTIFKRPDFIFSALAGALLLATAYYWILLQASLFSMLIANISSQPVYFTALKILVPASLILFGLNFGLSTILFRAGSGMKSLGSSLLGGLVGGFGVGCPLCGAFLLSLIGVTAGLAALPFAGLEIWVATVAVMAVSLNRALVRLDKSTCDPEATTPTCWRLPAVHVRLIMAFVILNLGLLANLFWMFVRYG